MTDPGRSFNIVLRFTHFADFDDEEFAEAVFDLLCSGPAVLDEFDYSCDGWDEERHV